MDWAVSIIIPVYNVAPYIEACLESVMRQTYGGQMECIIVDDCGTDDSIVIAEQMTAVYQGFIRFRTLHHEHNRGLSAARNTGTIAARGDYIYYIDSDDVLAEDCIEKLMAVVLHHPEIEMVQGNARIDFTDYTNNKSHIEKDPYTRLFPKNYLTSNKEVRACYYQNKLIPVNAWNKLIKRSFLTKYHLLFKEGILFEDELWSFCYLRFIKNVGFVSDITYIHKRRTSSIMTGTDKKTEAYYRSIIFQNIITHLTSGYEKEEYRFYSMLFADYYSRLAYCSQVFRETFPQYWQQAWQLKCYGMGGRLAVSYVLGRSVLYAKVYEGLRTLKRWGASGISRSRGLSGTR